MDYHEFQQITSKLKMVAKKKRRHELEYFAFNLYL